MMELLVHPYRELDESRVDEFYGLLSTYPNLDWVAPNLEIADLAAWVRARHHLQSPDALQAATAAHAKATGLITNDPVFERVKAFETGAGGVTGAFLLVLGVLLLFVGVGAGVAGLMAYAPILYVAQVFVGTWLGNKIMGLPSAATSAVVGRAGCGTADPSRRGIHSRSWSARVAGGSAVGDGGGFAGSSECRRWRARQFPHD